MAIRRKDGTWAKRNVMGHIYVIHFDSPITYLRGGKEIQVGHYIGFTEDLDARINDHKTNQGARILKALNERGIGWSVESVYAGSRFDERKMKSRGRMWKFCKLCGDKNGWIPKCLEAVK